VRHPGFQTHDDDSLCAAACRDEDKANSAAVRSVCWQWRAIADSGKGGGAAGGSPLHPVKAEENGAAAF